MLKKASRKLSTHVGTASLVGVGLGLYCASRLRSMRLAYFKAFKVIVAHRSKFPRNNGILGHGKAYRNSICRRSYGYVKMPFT